MNDHTTVEVFSPHYCDFHVADKVPAEYDAATTMGLGLGMGQRLILKTS